MTKNRKRFLSAFLAVVMLLSMVPFSAMAAPASDLPDNMVDSPILRALEYTGYDVQAQKDNGTLYQSGSYGSRCPESIRSNIHYGTNMSGKETVADSSTVTGRAPDIAKFEKNGLCCAAFVTYYVCNYLPNIEGADTQFILDAINATGMNSQAVVTWQTALNKLVKDGEIEKIGTSSSNVDRSKLAPGDLIIFGNDESSHTHIAVYSGTYKGTDFLIHVGNDRGPEIMPVAWMSDSSNGNKASYPNAYYHLPEDIIQTTGKIEVYKKDTDGKALAGATFVATSTTDSSVQYKIGPTDSKGYASVDNVKYDTYKIKETVFPTNYRSYGTTEWTVTLNGDSPNGTVTVNAVNELIPGNCQIVKTSEDGVVDGIDFTIKGNGVNKTVTTANGGKVTVKDLKPGTYTVTEETIDYYEPQEVRSVTVVSGQTATVTFNNVLKRGDLSVSKTSEDGLVEGVQFKLSGTSLSGHKVEQFAITNSKGIATFEDVLISGHASYVLEEVNTAAKYIVPANQSAVIKWNEVTNNYMYNELKRGDVRVTKNSEDGLVEGIRFRLYGTSLSGEKVDLYATTDYSGVAVFNDVLIGENYVLEEVNTQVKYVIPEPQSAVVEWDKTTNYTFKNILKKFRVDVFKVDGNIFWGDDNDSGLVPVSVMSLNGELPKNSDDVVDMYGWPYGLSQGDATLEGAVYGLYNGSELVATYTTDKNGYFITDYFVCGSEWYIQEITPSEGYLLDPYPYYLDVSAGNYSVELNTEYLDVYEERIDGKISIIKHADDGSTQIEKPEKNAVFEIYLKSAGSYEKADETERAILVTDKYGYAETDWLPYGVYVVKQIEGLEGKELMPAFEVNIDTNEEIYRYLINNATFMADIVIQKADAETGKIIPAAGVGFKVRNKDTGEFVVQHINYPEQMDIDVYYTTADGTLMMPYALPYGQYEIIEQCTAYGYVLDGTPVPFEVDGSTVLVTVTKSNMPQKGIINLTKTGEVFFTVSEKDGMYQPVYQISGLEGAVFGVFADEDIYTPDGTLRYEKDQKVDTITTGADGIATTKELYLGKYRLKEEKAAYGMVLNDEILYAELIYAGEEISVTSTAVSMINERQKVILDLLKTMEQDETFKLGMNDEISKVKFGLYAAETLAAKDGKEIPKDGLLEIVTCSKDGKAVFNTDIPVGSKLYVKEYATDCNYILSDTVYAVEFVYAGQDVATVAISVNDGTAIDNKIIRGDIEGLKKDEDGNVLAGAVFGLFWADTTEFTEETAILTSTSDENGVFGFENIPVGKWLIKELSCPEQFVLSDEVFTAEITKDGQVIEIEVVNEFITGIIEITKTDADNGNKLSGAVFEVYVDVDGDKKFNAEIDTLHGTLGETESGIYLLEGLRFGGYFLFESESPEFFLPNGEYYYFAIVEDGVTVTLETADGKGFENQPFRGSVTVTKTDSENGDLLSGAVFEVYADVNNNQVFDKDIDTLVGKLNETEKGKYLLEKLHFGGYFLYEAEGIKFYLRNTEYHYFSIDEDGEVIAVETTEGKGFENVPYKGAIKIVKKDAKSGERLSGVEFGLYNTEGKELAKGVTDDNGEIIFNNLRAGKYEVRELTAKDGYYKVEDTFSAEITENEQVIVFEVDNTKIPETPPTDSPQTGDNSNMGLWFTLLVLSLLALVGLCIYNRKARN